MASSSDPSNAEPGPSMAKLVIGMAVFVLLGFPLVGYLWDTLNELLALEVNTTRLLLTVPVIALLGALLWMLSKAVNRWQTPTDPG